MIPPWHKKRVSPGGREFIFTVVTTTPGETFGLPLEITGNYDFNADWGDGSDSDITLWNHADTIHPYATPGTHEISITGIIIGWSFNNGGDCAKYYETKNVGPLRVGNSGGYWLGCVNHAWTGTDILDMTGTLIFTNGFHTNSGLTTIPSILSWDWSNVTSTAFLFTNDNSFNQDISNVIQAANGNISGMLWNASSFDQDLGGCVITGVTDAANFLANVTLSVPNYNALILSWSAQAQTIVANFHGGNSKYTGGGAVETARDAWVLKGWVLTDGGTA